MRKWILMSIGVLCLGFYVFVGFPPTLPNHAPAYLRLERDVLDRNIVTWVGRADRYEVVSYRTLFSGASHSFIAEEFYLVSEPRFEEENILEGLTYQYRVRVIGEDGAPVSRWSRSVKRTLDVRNYENNVYTTPPTPVGGE